MYISYYQSKNMDELHIVTPTFDEKYFGEPGVKVLKGGVGLNKGCNCGQPNCTYGTGEGSPLWLEDESGEQIFTGIVALYTGEYKKLDKPKDLLDESNHDKSLPGHLMTLWEYA